MIMSNTCLSGGSFLHLRRSKRGVPEVCQAALHGRLIERKRCIKPAAGVTRRLCPADIASPAHPQPCWPPRRPDRSALVRPGPGDTADSHC